GTLTATVTRTGITTGASSVTWSITGGSATGGGVDYSATPGTISWVAGDATPKTITITLVDDFIIEAGNETINLQLSAPSGGTLGAQTTAVATIIDDDAPGTMQFTSATYSVSENGGTASITLSRTGGVGGTVSVVINTSDGTAQGGLDYTTSGTTISWPPGDSLNKTFTVPILTDSLPEGPETVNLTLSAPTGGTLGAQSTAVLTILDSAGTIAFSSPTYSVNENGVTATITVNRSGGNGGAVGVTFATSNGTATSPADYAANTNTLSWADGDTAAKTFTVS